MFNGRLGLVATVYEARTRDALVGVTFPPSEGFLNSRTENVGSLMTRGLELHVGAGLLRTSWLDWRARVNLSFMDSEALDLAGEEIFADNKAEFREGYPTPTYFGTRIMNPDAFADPILVGDTAIGSVFPTRIYGFGTTVRLLRNVTLDGLAEFQGGHYLPNYTGYQNARRGVWFPCYDTQEKQIAFDRADATALNGVTALERARCSLDDSNSDYWVEKADFLKLRSLSLTYELPAKLLRFTRSASITVAGRNLYTWTDYSGTDPEVEDFADRSSTVFDGNGDFGRRDYYSLPSPRTFLVSMRVGF